MNTPQQLTLTKQNLTKKELIENIQKWAVVDSQLKKIGEKVKEFRDVKSKLSISICQYLKENNMQNTKIELDNGQIKIYDKKEYPPLTFGYVEECLGKLIPDKSQVDFVIQYLKTNREIKTTMDLRRIYKNEPIQHEIDDV